MDRKYIRFCNAFLLMAATLGSSVLAQKSTDTRLDTDLPGAASSQAPQIAASGDSVYVTWEDSRNGGSDIYFTRSFDGGGTWLAADNRLNTDPAGVASSAAPQIVALGDRVYVTWQDSRDGELDIYFNRSLDGGTTWLGSDVRLDTDLRGSSNSDLPQIALSGEGVSVTWQDARNGSEDIYFNRSSDGGATWLSSDLRLNTDSAGAAASVTPQIATSGESTYVIWKDSRNAFSEVHLNRSSDRGATWLAADIRVDTNTILDGHAAVENPQITVSGDCIHVVWRNLNFQVDNLWLTIESNHSLDGGATWLPTDNQLNHTSRFQISLRECPQIASAGDSVYVTWNDTRSSLVDSVFFNRSLDAGANWLQSDLRIDSDLPRGTTRSCPKITAAGESVYVTWLTTRNGKGDIYFTRSLDGGTTWLPDEIRLDTDEPGMAASVEPQIASSDDSVYVVWTDNRNGNEDIYFNIPFGSQPYGNGTRGTGDMVPRLEGTDSLTLGSTFTLSIENGLGGAFGLIALGARDSKASIPFAGGSLLLDPIDHAVPILLNGATGVAGAGTLDIEFTIPVDNAFLGFNVNFQAGLLDPNAVEGLSLTNAVEAWIL